MTTLTNGCSRYNKLHGVDQALITNSCPRGQQNADCHAGGDDAHFASWIPSCFLHSRCFCLRIHSYLCRITIGSTMAAGTVPAGREHDASIVAWYLDHRETLASLSTVSAGSDAPPISPHLLFFATTIVFAFRPFQSPAVEQQYRFAALQRIYWEQTGAACRGEDFVPLVLSPRMVLVPQEGKKGGAASAGGGKKLEELQAMVAEGLVSHLHEAVQRRRAPGGRPQLRGPPTAGGAASARGSPEACCGIRRRIRPRTGTSLPSPADDGARGRSTEGARGARRAAAGLRTPQCAAKCKRAAQAARLPSCDGSGRPHLHTARGPAP